MRILAIETSCDETAISIIKCTNKKSTTNFEVLSNFISSQIKIHAPYGGVFPALAKREHIKNLPILFKKNLKKAKLENTKKPFDVVVVTSGPGLEPALWTGIVFAKELAQKYKIPLVPTNHMEGHIFSVFAKNKGSFSIPKINFPIISLLISGGHTELILIKDWKKYKLIGETLDDACGEAFDKVARMLELPYPGGPEISKLATIARKSKPTKNIKLPRPMIYSKDFNFSFSGLKTAVLYLIRDFKIEDENILKDEITKQEIALEFENAVVETLIHKTKKAIEKHNAKTIIIGGGVASNKFLRKEIKKLSIQKRLKLFTPAKGLTTDNSIMIGVAGYLEYISKKNKYTHNTKIKAEGNLHL